MMGGLTKLVVDATIRTMAHLEDDLKAATHCVALRARRFSRLVTRRYDHALRGAGLTAAQFSLLGAIALKQPVAPVALVRMLDLEKSTLSRNLRPLVASKLLRSDGPKEGGQLLTVTPKGRDTLQKAIPAWRQAQADVLSLIGADIVPKLDRMISNMRTS